MEKEKKQLTLEEYKEQYNQPESAKTAKTFLILAIGGLGIIIIAMLALLSLRIYELNEIAGYIAIGVSILVFFFLYLLPIIKINKTKAFKTDVTKDNPLNAKKHNRKLRNEIADKMIEYNATVTDASWYNKDLVAKLADARIKKDNEKVKDLLSEIYSTDVKKESNSIIRNASIKVGLLTALSQSEKVDTLLVVTYELMMIKDIVYLYGFRPSNAKLWKIYLSVIRNALIAYGASNVSTSFATNTANAIAEALGARTALGNLISTIIGGATMGIINGTLSIIIGFQTRKYLMKEYHLQDVLDNVYISEEEENEMMDEIKSDIIKASKKKKRKAAEAA